MEISICINSPETNTLDVYRIGDLCTSLTTLVSKVNNAVTMNIQEPYLGAYLDFYSRKIGITTDVIVNIPHAIAAGGVGNGDKYIQSINNGTAGTADNTCNGGGGGCVSNNNNYKGGTGCIFGQYAASSNGYGYGSSASSKYRCALIFVIKGNLTINESGTITQIGGNGGSTYNSNEGYGGGAQYAGGGGAPIFIYYTNSYINNGTINTAGGTGYYNSTYTQYYGAHGGAGGIKITQITL